MYLRRVIYTIVEPPLITREIIRTVTACALLSRIVDKISPQITHAWSKIEVVARKNTRVFGLILCFFFKSQYLSKKCQLRNFSRNIFRTPPLFALLGGTFINYVMYFSPYYAVIRCFILFSPFNNRQRKII